MAEAFGITCHEWVSLDFRCGSRRDFPWCYWRGLLRVKRTKSARKRTSARSPLEPWHERASRPRRCQAPAPLVLFVPHLRGNALHKVIRQQSPSLQPRVEAASHLLDQASAQSQTALHHAATGGHHLILEFCSWSAPLFLHLGGAYNERAIPHPDHGGRRITRGGAHGGSGFFRIAKSSGSFFFE